MLSGAVTQPVTAGGDSGCAAAKSGDLLKCLAKSATGRTEHATVVAA
jgi:hypothetical protein